MDPNNVIFSIFLIFAGAAFFATVALYTRQSLLVVYILLGVLLGPWGIKLIANVNLVHNVGEIGIIFLLFLLGLNLHPQDLLHLLRKTFWVTLLSSILFLVIGFSVSYLFGFTVVESLLIGVAMTFSSTIIGLKLLPTSVLHHRHIGELMISILLLQDLIAIVVLLLIHIGGLHAFSWLRVMVLFCSLPILIIGAFLFVKFILIPLIRSFDRVHEYVFLLAIAWCLGMSELAKVVGFSYEVGAFIAGVAVAANPISMYIAESLKPLRDFFLVLFFFSIGAGFNLRYFPQLIAPALILAVTLVVVKPLAFRFLLYKVSETKKRAWEVGVRLGQTSSFSILVAYLAQRTGILSSSASYLVQATTILTFIISSYIVSFYYPTPLALSKELQRD